MVDLLGERLVVVGITAFPIRGIPVRIREESTVDVSASPAPWTLSDITFYKK